MTIPTFPPITPHVGEKVQLCKGNLCFDSRLIGYIRGVSLLVTTPLKEGMRIDFLEGEPLEVRMFSGRDIFSFATHVMHVCVAPIHYLHLDYPAETRMQPLRHGPWIRVKLPAMVQEGGMIQPVLMTNLSEEGAKLETPAELGQNGARIRVSFDAEADDLRRGMSLEARIEHVKAWGGMFEYGISFLGASGDDRLWLKCLVYRKIAEGCLI